MSFEEEQRTVRRQLDVEIKAKDAEVQRLKLQHEEFLLKHEKEKNLLLTVLDKQTTEIERLKAIVSSQKEALERWADAEGDRSQLITELTDALEEECSAQDYHDLVTRAREATK